MDRVFELLNRDYYLNYPLIFALNHGAEVVEAIENGVALRRHESNFLLLAGPNLPDVIKNIPRPEWAELCGSQHAQFIAEHFGFDGVMECHQLYYPHQSIASDLELEPLNLADADFVLENYQRLDSEEIKLAISEERLFGVRDNGQLFAFIGLHDDYTMGMLQVLPAYRRKGWGERLERALTTKVLAMGELPYGHVIAGNESSMQLQKKLGFVECSDKIYWMW